MAEKFGTENLKKVIKFGIDIAKQSEEAASDGWQWGTDPFKFIDELAQLPGLVEGVKGLQDEFNDLSQEEVAELQAWAVEEYEFVGNENVEAIVDDGLAIGIRFVSLGANIRKAIQAKKGSE